MKKMLSLIVAIAMIAAGSVTALAAVTAPTTTGDDVYTTSGVQGANEMMTLLVYSGSAITTESIQYIDQTVTDETGAYSFANYKTKVTLAPGESYTVKIGGENLADGPYTNTITKEAAGNAFAGTVSFVGTTAPTLTLTPAEGDAITVPVAADGKFSATVASGTYVLTVAKPYHLGYKDKSYEITADIADAAFAVKAGNVVLAGEGSLNVVDIEDLNALLGVYGTATTAPADVNESSNVDIEDLNALLANYGVSETVID